MERYIFQVLKMVNPNCGKLELVSEDHKKATFDVRKNFNYGVLVSTGRGKISFSLCDFDRGDEFDLERGIELALARFQNDRPIYFPRAIKKVDLDFFKGRVERYFKEEK